MINGEMTLDAPLRWAMVGGGRNSQIGYIHRSAALRDHSFQLVAGAFDIDAEAGRQFGVRLGVAAQRCYPDYQAMFDAEARRPDGIQAVSIATPSLPRPASFCFSVFQPWRFCSKRSCRTIFPARSTTVVVTA